jgi:hypothetical protein
MSDPSFHLIVSYQSVQHLLDFLSRASQSSLQVRTLDACVRLDDFEQFCHLESLECCVEQLLVRGLGVELGEFAVLRELDEIGLNPGLDHAMEALNVILRLETGCGLMVQGVAVFLQIHIAIISK